MSKKTTKKSTKKIDLVVTTDQSITPPSPSNGQKYEQIEKAAYFLSLQSKSYDDWVWMLAELMCRARSPHAVTEDEIKIAANALAVQGLRIDEIHWKIAELQNV